MTVYGSALNLASRLEQACKQMETPMMLYEDFGQLVSEGHYQNDFIQFELPIRGWQNRYLLAFMLRLKGNLSHAKQVYSWRRVSYD